VRPAGTGIAFNLSHSGGWSVVAVARGRRVGVDVEEVRSVAERESIVARFFSARERADLAALPGPLRHDAFFRIWTCKEACIKALGTGLATPLDRFSVAVDPREPPGLLEVVGDPAGAARWSIRDLGMGEGYAGAVAAEGRDWGLFCYEYEDAFSRGHS
jgi:4'-phosphopantetheinyl transferase